MYHTKSEQYSNLAEESLQKRDFARAIEYYRLAAEQETLALKEINLSKKRTYGVTALSAASLWYKAHEFQQAQGVAYMGLASNTLPPFAVKELQELLQYIWSEEARKKAGIEFTEGEVLVSVSGGEVVKGGAPLELILRKVDEVSKMFYRTVELLLDRPFRKRGGPSIEIQEQFRPWLFQAPAGSYQFAVRVERPKQMSLFPEATPQAEQITHKFLQIVKASVDDPEGDLVELVPRQEYRDAFLKLTRNLAPTGKLFGQLEIKSPSDVSARPIILNLTSREIINKALRKPEREGTEHAEEKVIELRGVLRGLQLDNDWLDVDIEEGQERKPIRIFEAGEAIDDVVGPMVNRRVVVDVVLRPIGRYAYRDIQMEE